MRRALLLFAAAATLAVFGLVFLDGGAPFRHHLFRASSGVASVGGAPAAAPASAGKRPREKGSAGPVPPPIGVFRAATGAGAITGRVLDGESGTPVAGAAIRFVDGAVSARGKTGRDGSYRFAVDKPWLIHECEAYLEARGPAGKYAVARVEVGLHEAEMRQRDLLLFPEQTVTVRVTDEANTPIPHAGIWTRAGVFGVRRLGETGEKGTAAVAFPRGASRLFVTASGYATRLAWVRVPVRGGVVSVVMSPELRKRVRVVFAGDGAPVEGARLEVHWMRERLPVFPAPTDAEGRTELSGVAAGFQVEVFLKSDARTRSSKGALAMTRHQYSIEEGPSEQRIAVPRPQTLAWPIVDGDIPVPPDGTRIRLVPDGTTFSCDPPAEGVVSGGALVVSAWRFGRLEAWALGPHGTAAHLLRTKDETTCHAIAFRRRARCEVEVLDAKGAPVPGCGVSVCRHNPLPLARADTNESGIVVFRDLFPDLVTIQALSDAEHATVDLRKGDARVVLRPRRTFAQPILVHVLVDGKPELPPHLRVSGFREEGRDASAATIRGTVQVTRLGTDLMIKLFSGGQEAWEDRNATLQSAPIETTLRFQSKHTVRVHFLPPVLASREDCGEIRLGDWQAHDLPPKGDSVTFDGVPPGSYRLSVAGPHAGFGEVSVVVGKRPPVATIDLSRAGWAEGRVLVPGGEDASAAWISLEGPGMDEKAHAADVNGDGTFQVLVPGDRRVRIVPHHPRLYAAPEDGAVAVTAPTGDLCLRLVRGPVLRFSAPRFPPAPRNEAQQLARRKLGVTLGSAGGTLELVPQVRDGVVTCRGFPPGAYRLRIDVPGFVPYEKDLSLRGEGTDLGTLPLDRGSAVLARIQVPEGQAPPAIYVEVKSIATPGYIRSGASDGEGVVTVAGLAAGKYRVWAGSPDLVLTNFTLLDRTIRVDGVHDVALTVDLR